MKFNQWTLGLAAAGVVSLGSVAQAEEAAHQVMTALSSTTLFGYVSTSAIWNPDTDDHGRNGGVNNVPGRVPWNNHDKQDRVNLDVIKLGLERPLTEGDWAAGFKVELLFGPDAAGYNTTSASAVNSGQDNGDFAIKQAYVALRAPVGNGIDFKIGVWDNLIGYEVFDSGNNPNFTRSYGYFIEPTAMTGVQASYRFSDWISATLGFADNYQAGINTTQVNESTKTYTGMVTLTAPDSMGWAKGATLNIGAVVGGQSAPSRGGDPGAWGTDIINYYVGVTLPLPITGLTAGAAFDYRTDALSDGSEELVLGGYVSWQATEKLRLSARLEAFNSDEDGPSIFATGFGGATGMESGWEATVTLDYKMWENVLSRLEVRYDNADFLPGRKFRGGSGFGDGGEDDAFIIAANIIYSF